MSDTILAPLAPEVNPRVALSKRLRFEVFKRDDFTCQYCGAQPPAVVLEVDHIHPVAEGGKNDTENLITACEACNRGKGKRLLGNAAVRPDANLLWLKTQQEIAELERYQKAKKRRDKLMARSISALQDVWAEAFCEQNGYVPADVVYKQWLQVFSQKTLKRLPISPLSPEDAGTPIP